jgi:hypothetical protein
VCVCVSAAGCVSVAVGPCGGAWNTNQKSGPCRGFKWNLQGSTQSGLSTPGTVLQSSGVGATKEIAYKTRRYSS